MGKTTFVQLKEGEACFRKCLKAIDKMAEVSAEPWRKSFIEQAEKDGHLPNMIVLCHFWQGVKNTDITWERIEQYAQEPKFYYENSNGVLLNVTLEHGTSHVAKSIGLPEQLVSRLEGIRDNVAFNQELDPLRRNFLYRDDLELRIHEYFD